MSAAPIPLRLAVCSLGQPHPQATQGARRLGLRLLAEARTQVGPSPGAPAGVAPLHISRSACDGLGIVALASGSPVGVDVEPLREACETRAPWCHPQETVPTAEAALALWVRKEAVLKALGLGLALPPEQVRVGPASPDWQGVCLGLWGSAQVCSLNWPGFTLAVALAWEPGTPLQTRRPVLEAHSAV